MKRVRYDGAEWVLVLAMAFFGAFFIFPVLRTVGEAFFVDGGFTLRYVMDVLNDATYLEGLGNAFQLGIWSTVVAVLIALPLAILADRFDFPAKRFLTTLLLVPLVLPPFVGAIGIKQILGQSGALNSFLSVFGLVDMDHPVDWLGQWRFGGMVLMTALHLYPIIYLNVSAALANLDPALEEAAENLGCAPAKSFFFITLPMALPGLFAGCTVAFIWGFTELGVPLVFDFTRITSVQIFDGIKDLGKSPFPYALVAVVLTLTATLFFLSKRLIGGRDLSSSGRASVGRREARPLRGASMRGCVAFFIFIILFALLPHAGIVFVAFSGDWYLSVLPSSLTLQHFQEALGHPITLPSIANSLRYASLAMILNVVLGVAIAYVVVRTKVRGREWLDVLSMLPLAVPGLVLAFGYLAITREGELFRWLVDLPPFISEDSPLLLLVIAYAVRRLPYIVRDAAAGFQQTSASLEEAAANLGAGPITTFLRITGPLIAANLIAGAILAFAFSMLEVSDSLILAQEQRFFPVTKAIYVLFGSLGNGPFLAAALGVWAMVFLSVSIIGAGYVMGKKMGALFRV
jgi:iron(III) transport system permease protein